LSAHKAALACDLDSGKIVVDGRPVSKLVLEGALRPKVGAAVVGRVRYRLRTKTVEQFLRLVQNKQGGRVPHVPGERSQPEPRVDGRVDGAMVLKVSKEGRRGRVRRGR